MKSARFPAGTFELTTRTLVEKWVCDTGARSLMKSYGRFLYRLMFATSVAEATRNVCPINGRRFSAITRAVISVLPPGAKGTTKRMGFAGHVSAAPAHAALADRR